MAAFTIVDKIPNGIAKTAYVIEKPNFIEDVKLFNHKKPRNNIATINYLRSLVAKIGTKYYGDTFDTFKVSVSKYKGISIETDDQTQDLLVQMISEKYPDLLDRYVEKQIIDRPPGTQLIYFLGSLQNTSAFQTHGIAEVSPKDAHKEIKRSVVMNNTFSKPAPKKSTSNDKSLLPDKNEDGLIMPTLLKK